MNLTKNVSFGVSIKKTVFRNLKTVFLFNYSVVNLTKSLTSKLFFLAQQ